MIPVSDFGSDRSTKIIIKRMKIVLALMLSLIAFGMAGEPPREINQPSIQAAIRAVLDQQVKDWNL